MNKFKNIASPISKKLNYTSTAKNFISVQPMNVPSGLLFYLDFIEKKKYKKEQKKYRQYSDKDIIYFK